MSTAKKTVWWQVCFDILFPTILSLIVVAYAYPELLWKQNLRFTSLHDLQLPNEAIFFWANQFHWKDFNLWNMYDLYNHAYPHLSAGIFCIPYFIGGLLLSIIGPKFFFIGEAFQHFHAIFWTSFLALNRAIGGYFLLRLLKCNRIVIFISLILLNTLLATPAYCGLLVNFLYSLTPLLSYFILCFFMEFRLKPLLGAFLVFTIAVANSPLFALGYFYENIHYILVGLFIISFAIHKEKTWQHFRGEFFKDLNFKSLLLVLGCVLLAVVIMLPSLSLYPSLKQDYILADSGLGGTSGRFQNICNPIRYFKSAWGGAGIENFLKESLNYSQNTYWHSWSFIGISTFVLSIIGVIASRNTYRWAFAGAIALVVMANAPRLPLTPFSLPHIINAITNPFAFLVRSHHMTALVMPFNFLPLVALGIQSFFQSTSLQRKQICFVVFITLFLFTGSFLMHTIYWPYVCIVGLAAVVTYFWQRSEQITKKTAIIISSFLVLMLATDTYLLRQYFKGPFLTKDTIHPRTFSTLESHGSVIIDYQNPMLRIFTHFLRPYEVPQVTWPDPGASFFGHQNFCGTYLHTFLLGRYFAKPMIYMPEHIVYADLYRDEPAKQNLIRNPRIIYHASYAFPAEQFNLAQIVDRNLDYETVLVQDAPVSILDHQLPSSMKNLPDPFADAFEDVIYEFDAKNAEIKHHENIKILSFSLPKKFPIYEATTLSTRDAERLKLIVDGVTLQVAQGHLFRPQTFDVQNVATGKLAVAVPNESTSLPQKISLTLKHSRLVPDMRHVSGDKLEFDYMPNRDGWFVIRFPFDKKWCAKLDNQVTKIYQINKRFMGFPVSKGKHLITLEYLPSTPLRWMIPVIMILTCLTYFSIIGVTFFRLSKE